MGSEIQSDNIFDSYQKSVTWTGISSKFEKPLLYFINVHTKAIVLSQNVLLVRLPSSTNNIQLT